MNKNNNKYKKRDDKNKGWRAILQFVRERNYSCH